jgi:hypothetical protein
VTCEESEKDMKKIITVLTLCASIFALSFPAQAQQPAKIPRVGVLISASPSIASQRIHAFQQGLRELNYVEGRTSSLNTDMRKER